MPTDPVAAAIVAGKWHAPKAGDTVALPDGATRSWARLPAGADGVFTGRPLMGGYAFFTFDSDVAGVRILEAAGHAMAYVNGVPRTGDVYSNGSVHLPVFVKKGANELLVHVARGRLQIKLTKPKADVFLSLVDATTPDLIAGEEFDGWAGVLAVNATQQTQSGLRIVAAGLETKLPALPPCSVSKVPVQIRRAAATAGAKIEVKLELIGEKPLDEVKLALNVAKPEALQKRTFRSAIDGSVQYFALVPANPGEKGPTPGLVLTLHGAGVEGLGQAACLFAEAVGARRRRD